MATTYVISLGYQPRINTPKAWEIMKHWAGRIASQPHALAQLAFDTQHKQECKFEELLEYARHYQKCEDLTLVIDDDKMEVRQTVSGDDRIKRPLRQTFCRMLIQACHALDVEVNLTTA